MRPQSIGARSAKSTDVRDDYIKGSNVEGVCIGGTFITDACIDDASNKGAFIGSACVKTSYSRGGNLMF